MLQLYDNSKIKIEGLTKYKDLSVESVLSSGDKTLSFLYPSLYAGNIQEEGYIRTQDAEFVIKEIEDQVEWKTIKATLNVENLEGKAWGRFDSTEQTITNCLNLALVGTGWAIGTCTVTKLRTVRKTCCSSWDIIQEARKVYRAEMEFDTLNKKINIVAQLGSDKGCYFIDSLNLKALTIQRNSYDYYTRIIAEGKDGLVLVAPGYLENYQYSNKIKTFYWKDERYTDLESLTEDAGLKLDEVSKPYRAYSASVQDLANISDTYKDILSYGLGDIVTLISKDMKVKEKQRIVKITEYLEEPEKNTCEIANVTLTFEDVQKEQQDTTDTVNNITEDDGTISQAAIQTAVERITIMKADVQDLNAITARVGTLETTTAHITNGIIDNATIDAAKVNNLSVNYAHITNGIIDNAVVGTAAIGTTQIADGSITDAKIVGLTANKITAGTIDAAQITVVNLNCANLTVGTINGSQIANGAIDPTKLTTDLNNTINTASTNASNALTSANGKNTVYYQTTQPSGGTYRSGDTWFDTDDGNKIYHYNGSAWVASQLGTNAIANLSITNALIADATIASAKIAALDAGKITTGTLAAARIAAGTITGTMIAATTITASNIVANTITASQIAAGTITATQIASRTITADRIVTGAITANEIASATITANKMVANTITAASGIIADAAITTAKIADASITDAKIVNLTANKITAGTMSADRISGGTITGATLRTSSTQNYATVTGNTFELYQTWASGAGAYNGVAIPCFAAQQSGAGMQLYLQSPTSDGSLMALSLTTDSNGGHIIAGSAGAYNLNIESPLKATKGLVPAFSWTGTIPSGSGDAYINHNLGYTPIIVPYGTAYNVILNFSVVNNNQVRATNYSSGGNSWTGTIFFY